MMSILVLDTLFVVILGLLPIVLENGIDPFAHDTKSFYPDHNAIGHWFGFRSS